MEAITEIASGADVDDVLEHYSRLDPDAVRALGADRFPPSGPIGIVP